MVSHGDRAFYATINPCNGNNCRLYVVTPTAANRNFHVYTRDFLKKGKNTVEV